MDFEQARYYMVEQQIRPWDVLDSAVLAQLLKVKREDFVPAALRELALADVDLPIGNGRRLWQPKLEARAVQDVKPQAGDRALVIGSDCGYLSALLGSLCKQVYGVDPDASLVEASRAAVAKAGLLNVSFEVGDASNGWSSHAPYDVIIATASYPLPPEALFAQLAEGGRLFAVVGEAPAMSAMVYTKQSGKISHKSLFETVLPAFASAPKVAQFTF